MTTIEKIEKLNKECNNSINIVHHSEWEINSYETDTPLSMEKFYPYFHDKSLKKVVDMAYQFVFGVN